ncbi:MAG TPA: alpha/beta hydrolase [Cyclobacteriaceae bacterium]|nr:alpha/beta hydrolase [Cyclobacteriaceae bacterium]
MKELLLYTIYLFPGQGADERLFSALTFNEGYKVVNIRYPEPRHGETMASFAEAIKPQINVNEKYIFIGVSLGGMIISELAAITNPEKVILISSAKCRGELPRLYRLQGRLRINKAVPGSLTRYGAILLQGIVEPDSWTNREIFQDMLKRKTPVYFKRTVDMIVNWNRKIPMENVVHIHGTGDHTLPIRLVKPDYTVKGGSHMMVLTKGAEITKLVNEILMQGNSR